MCTGVLFTTVKFYEIYIFWIFASPTEFPMCELQYMFFSRPVFHALHCSNQGAHIFVHCYSIDKEQFCSEMGWKLLESMWRNSLSQSSIQSDTHSFSRLHYNSKEHSFTPWQWAKVVLIGVPECVSFEFALHCISWQCTAEIAMRCNSIAWAWHTHSGNARAVCAQPSKPNWS